jgi:hypothetical protein
VLEQFDSYRKKILHTLKVNSKWIIDLNIKYSIYEKKSWIKPWGIRATPRILIFNISRKY